MTRKRREKMELAALKFVAAGIGAGLTVIGAALGLGKIGNAALEGTARQPEAANAIRTTMIIIAALLEGAARLGLGACRRGFGLVGLLEKLRGLETASSLRSALAFFSGVPKPKRFSGCTLGTK